MHLLLRATVLLAGVALVTGCGCAEELLTIAPCLVAAGLLLQRCYVGEDLLVALLERARARGDLPPRAVQPAIPRPQVRALVARGGRLLGHALAVRPPPATARS